MHVLLRLLAAFVLFFLPVRTSSAGDLDITTATKRFSDGLKGEIERVVASHDGTMGVSLKHLSSGEEINVNGDELFPTASTIKVAVMCAAFEMLSERGGPFKDYYDTRSYDENTSVSGSGFLQRFRNGTKMELKELMHLMITVSDNVATNMILEWMGGLEPVNDWLQRNGFEQTRIASSVGGKIIWSPEMRQRWGLGVTTPHEMRRLMELIVQGSAGTTSATDEMLRLLGNQYFDGAIPAEIPPTIYVGSKSGSLSRSRSDVAIVAAPTGTYILSVFTKDNNDRSWGRANQAEESIRKVSRLVWKHYNPESDWKRPEGAQLL